MFGQQKRMTWAQTGTIYGILGAIFYIGIVYTWAFLNSSQGGLIAGWNEPVRYVTFFGLLLFAPVVTFPSIVLSFLGPAVTTDIRTVAMAVSLPLMGACIGTVLGHMVNWWEKNGGKQMIIPLKTR